MNEILSDSKFSETEDVQASIIMALSDMFNIFSTHNVRWAQISF